MTGPEHFAEAERLLAYPEVAAGEDLAQPQREWLANLPRAQVHATLAQAAATAFAAGRATTPQVQAWLDVAG